MSLKLKLQRHQEEIETGSNNHAGMAATAVRKVASLCTVPSRGFKRCRRHHGWCNGLLCLRVSKSVLHTYRHTYLYECTSIYIYIYKHVRMHTRMHIHIQLHIYICIYIYISIYICIHIPIHIRVHIHMHIQINTLM